MRFRQTSPGFSLAEVLITLAILGVIATFTVPKIFNTPNATLNSKQTAMAKDAAFMVLSAYEQYRAANSSVTTGTTLGLLTPYMNYTSITTSVTPDDHPPNTGSYDCNSNLTCLRLHNGGTLFWRTNMSFNGTASTNGIYFFFDPDSVYTPGTTNGPGKTLCMFLYYDGTFRSRATTKSGSYNSWGGPFNSGSFDPWWFTGFKYALNNIGHPLWIQEPRGKCCHVIFLVVQ